MFVVSFFFSSRRRHTRLQGDWSSDVCSSDLISTWRGLAWRLAAGVLSRILSRSRRGGGFLSRSPHRMLSAEADPMEEMSVSPETPAAAQRGASPQGLGPRDLRDWIARGEAIGQLKRITEEGSRDGEMGAITYMAHQEIGAPAPLFERIKGSPRGFRALWNPLGSSVDRFALAIGEP